MNTFSYIATDSKGRTVRGKIQAADNNDLIEILKQQSLFCTSYKVLEQRVAKTKYKFKTKELAFFCRQLSSMLTAGISLVKALQILVQQEDKPKPKAVLSEMYDDVQRGTSFSETVASRSNIFPPLFVSMVSAGESSGNLDVVMTRVSDHFAKESALNNKIRGALVYPIILVIATVGITLALFIFILPMFMDMFDNPDEIPALTQVLMAISNFLKNQWYLVLAGVAAIVIAIRVMMNKPKTRYYYDKIICTMPKVGKLLCKVYTARFARTMANLFASGLQMVDCIEKSVGTLGNYYVSKRFEEVIEDVKRGTSLSTSMAKTKLFDNMFTSIIYVGEESGALDSILEKTADYYDEEADSAISKLVALINPIMILFIAGMIMLILAGIYPALYTSLGAIAG